MEGGEGRKVSDSRGRTTVTITNNTKNTNNDKGKGACEGGTWRCMPEHSGIYFFLLRNHLLKNACF